MLEDAESFYEQDRTDLAAFAPCFVDGLIPEEMGLGPLENACARRRSRSRLGADESCDDTTTAEQRRVMEGWAFLL